MIFSLGLQGLVTVSNDLYSRTNEKKNENPPKKRVKEVPLTVIFLELETSGSPIEKHEGRLLQLQRLGVELLGQRKVLIHERLVALLNQALSTLNRHSVYGGQLNIVPFPFSRTFKVESVPRRKKKEEEGEEKEKKKKKRKFLEDSVALSKTDQIFQEIGEENIKDRRILKISRSWQPCNIWRPSRK